MHSTAFFAIVRSHPSAVGTKRSWRKSIKIIVELTQSKRKQLLELTNTGKTAVRKLKLDLTTTG